MATLTGPISRSVMGVQATFLLIMVHHIYRHITVISVLRIMSVLRIISVVRTKWVSQFRLVEVSTAALVPVLRKALVAALDCLVVVADSPRCLHRTLCPTSSGRWREGAAEVCLVLMSPECFAQCLLLLIWRCPYSPHVRLCVTLALKHGIELAASKMSVSCMSEDRRVTLTGYARIC